MAGASAAGKSNRGKLEQETTPGPDRPIQDAKSPPKKEREKSPGSSRSKRSKKSKKMLGSLANQSIMEKEKESGSGSASEGSGSESEASGSGSGSGS